MSSGSGRSITMRCVSGRSRSRSPKRPVTGRDISATERKQRGLSGSSDFRIGFSDRGATLWVPFFSQVCAAVAECFESPAAVTIAARQKGALYVSA